ncbi:MAG: DoxX family protein [Thermoleophilaceae bacterium]
MFLASAVVSALLAAVLAFAALRKLSHREEVVETYARVGVPEDRLDSLAVILLAGAAGLVLGLFWAPIGVAAAGGVGIYFVAAIGFHIRADDTANLPTPLVIAVLAAAALVLRLASA